LIEVAKSRGLPTKLLDNNGEVDEKRLCAELREAFLEFDASLANSKEVEGAVNAEASPNENKEYSAVVGGAEEGKEETGSTGVDLRAKVASVLSEKRVGESLFRVWWIEQQQQHQSVDQWSNGKALVFSVDHKPDASVERERVEKAGGVVDVG
jgi:hypothetical protein